MRAIVTGAGGFVGPYLIEHLLAHGDEIFAVSLADESKSLPFRLEYFDITDQEACRRAISSFKPQVIYHLAGISFVPEAEDDFRKALLVNVLGTSNIYRTCHLLQLNCKVVLISSAEVYGKISPADLPVSETTKTSPANNYSLSKFMAEAVARRYAEAGTVSSVIIRPFNHIGPGQDSRFVASSFARQLAKIKLGKNSSVLHVGNLEAKRDFTDVRDIVRAYRLAAEKGQGLYNLASGKAIAIREILEELIKLSGLTVDITYDQSRMRPAEVAEVYADIGKADRELGWRPQIDIRETLKSLYNYWLEKESHS